MSSCFSFKSNQLAAINFFYPTFNQNVLVNHYPTVNQGLGRLLIIKNNVWIKVNSNDFFIKLFEGILGGNLGLFLGASMVTFIEIVVFIFTYFCQDKKKSNENTTHLKWYKPNVNSSAIFLQFSVSFKSKIIVLPLYWVV